MDLIGDIGGTNARFALVDNGVAGRPIPESVETLPSAAFSNLADAVVTYLDKLDTDSRPQSAAVAVASPVVADQVRLTNQNWDFSIRETRDHLGFRELAVVNDFTAKSLATSVLEAGDSIWAGGGDPDDLGRGRTVAVLGPGTGLGVGGLIVSAGHMQPLMSEGGHVSFAPLDEEEVEIARLLGQRFGRVSYERILCGSGLANLYEALAKINGEAARNLAPAEIVSAATMGDDVLARRCLTRFCAILGSFAGDLALTLGARGGIYIGGGIVPRFVDFLKTGPFRERLEDKGRFASYLKAIPARVITAQNPGLIGAAVALRHHYSGA
ncbi:MAG: glucokinase [Sphingomonadales bacterium]|nr:glucokinase [Sphingomonadales bacterium]